MGRLTSALWALPLLAAALVLTAQQARPGPTDLSVAQAVDFVPAAISPQTPTSVYFLPLVQGNCTSGCDAANTPIATSTALPSDTPTPLPSATPKPSDTPSPTTTPSSAPSPTRPPETLTLPVVADTFIVEGTTGQGDANFGDFPGMFVGYDEPAWRRERALMQVDLSPLPKDAVALRATLEVYIHNCFYCQPMNVDALRVTGAWSEYEATWNNSLTLPGEPYSRGVMVAPRRWLSIDITGLVRDWQAGVPNHGIMLAGREAPPYDWWSIEAREDGPDTAPRVNVTFLHPLNS